jgi:type IV secretory pathway VirB2 component (pilin)
VVSHQKEGWVPHRSQHERLCRTTVAHNRPVSEHGDRKDRRSKEEVMKAYMKRITRTKSFSDLVHLLAGVLIVFFAFQAIALAQVPWERAALNLQNSFTGALSRSLALVAIVIGGLMFMFGEGGAKRQIAGIVFGGGLALFAAQFLAWLF